MSKVIIISRVTRPFESPSSYFSVSYANGEEVESYTTYELDEILEHIKRYFEGDTNE